MTTKVITAPKEWLLSKISSVTGNAVRIALWDGTQIVPPGITPVGTVRLKDWRCLARLALDPGLYFGEEYSAGRIDIEGDLPQLLTAVYPAVSGKRTAWFPKLISRWLEWTQDNTLSGSRRNIRTHYDIGTDFYRLWLDSQLVYTCAYFASPSETLEQAQVEKMDHVCRKVQLQQGDTVVEAGCGWGALALHMARHYGAKVKAFNISHEQIVYARARAAREGLAGQVEFIEDDYRSISGRYDVFVSVGMLEHVGLGHYKELGNTIHRCLKDSGRGFLHFIGRNRPMRFNPWIRKRIFPGAYPPSLRESLEVFEEHDFSVLDIENLRLHYARTLENWLERFERSAGKVAEMLGTNFVRAWRLYLAGSIAAFRGGTLQLFQIVFARATNNLIPWTRAHLYTDDDQQEQKWIAAMS
ncbi:MAG TPA: cyclopropane-fatty-acyl-phospholipid synthase family protein [Acidobacteriota bacterium]|nr:cyclopropane-fatty-acyl-phospholipid synthase family protein [Acidobacteriota bacterium]